MRLATGKQSLFLALTICGCMTLQLLSALPVFAQDNEVRLLSEDTLTPSLASDPLGWWPFVSGNIGLMDYYNKNKDEDDGGSMMVKGVLSHYMPNRLWVFDAGIGAFQSGARDNIASGLVEGAARYRLTHNWEVGPVANFFVGNGKKFGSSTDSLTTFIGTSALYDIALNNGHLLRAGGRIMTDIGIPGQTANLFLFEVHYGLPFQSEASSSASNSVIPLEVQPAQASAADHLIRQAYQEDTKWPARSLAYSTRQVDPNSTDQKRISALAKELSELNLVERIRVIGHADERGSNYANKMLSQARAQSVANIIIFSGISQNQLEVVALGESFPIEAGSTTHAWDRNRRVELQFRGVRDQARLNALIQKYGLQ